MYIVFWLSIIERVFQIKKILKYFLIFIGVIAVIAIIVFVLIGILTNNERQIANDFTLLSSSGEYDEASNLMHNALKKEFTLDDFEEAFKNSQAYIETSFQSINIKKSVTTLEGIAKTADNCSSKLYFEVLEDKIISFNISPLCYKN